MNWETRATKICDCECHKEGTMIMHCVACCEFCYEKYMTPEGVIIPAKLGALMRESYIDRLQRQLNNRVDFQSELDNFTKNTEGNITIEALNKFYRETEERIKYKGIPLVKLTEAGLIDTVSTLVILPSRHLSDLSESEIKESIKYIEENGVKYFVPMTKDKVVCLSSGLMVATPGNYYDDWNEVPKEVKDV